MGPRILEQHAITFDRSADLRHACWPYTQVCLLLLAAPCAACLACTACQGLTLLLLQMLTCLLRFVSREKTHKAQVAASSQLPAAPAEAPADAAVKSATAPANADVKEGSAAPAAPTADTPPREQGSIWYFVSFMMSCWASALQQHVHERAEL